MKKVKPNYKKMKKIAKEQRKRKKLEEENKYKIGLRNTLKQIKKIMTLLHKKI